MRLTRHTVRDLLATLTLCLAACGDVPAGDPHAGMVPLQPPTHAYQLWYLTPPWEVVENSLGHAVLRVPTSGNPIVAGGTAGGVMGLVVDEIPGTDAVAWVTGQLAREVATGAVPAQAAVVRRATRPRLADGSVTTLDGSSRYAAMELPTGRLVTLVFSSPSGSLPDDPDVTQMLGLVTLGTGP